MRNTELDEAKVGIKIAGENIIGSSDGKASAYNAGDPGSISGWGSSLEKGMALHSSILAWRLPWIEEPGHKHLDTTE